MFTGYFVAVDQHPKKPLRVDIMLLISIFAWAMSNGSMILRLVTIKSHC